MQELLISPYLLALLFFIVSTVYSSVGLGGGTSYTALLAIFGASHRAIPTVSLTMNVLVATLGTINYLRGGHGRFNLIAPLLLTSTPMAYLGASIDIEQTFFFPFLIIILGVVAARIFLWPESKFAVDWTHRKKLALLLFGGAVLGFISGMVGIGGGIFLVPLIVVLGLGNAKEAAAAGAIFILLNSVAGLGGHARRYLPEFTEVAPLMVAVIAGGFLGSHLGAMRFKRRTVRFSVGVVVLIAIALLTSRIL